MAICNKCELVSTLIFNIVKSADNFMKIIGGAAQEIAVKNIKKKNEKCKCLEHGHMKEVMHTILALLHAN